MERAGSGGPTVQVPARAMTGEKQDYHQQDEHGTDERKDLEPGRGPTGRHRPREGSAFCHGACSVMESPHPERTTKFARQTVSHRDIMTDGDISYAGSVPKLWNDTIEEHRRTVHAAILDAAARLVAEHGLASVTMTQIAQSAGIGRATLYKYFPDVEAVMTAWHERQVTRHLQHLAAIGVDAEGPEQRLQAVLHAYAGIQYEHRGHPLAAILHHRPHMVGVRQQLRGFLADLLTEAAAAGHVRQDVPATELAAYCLHALDAATELSSKAGVERLVATTISGLRP